VCSYDDRIRAVKLYIKLGKRIELTTKQLGYPTKNALKSWHKEYELVKDLPSSFVRERSKYLVQQKQAAVEHYLNHGRFFIETIKALGYPCRYTLAAWLDEFHPDMKWHVVGRVLTDCKRVVEN
jgi:transposase-like protein